MITRKPTVPETVFLLFFHAIISGAFIVAYLSGDEDIYGMHVFSGYAVLVAVALRLLVGLVLPPASPLRLRRPNLRLTVDYLLALVRADVSARRQRSPLYAWMAAVVLVAAGLAAASGAIADFVSRLEDVHEALGEFALWMAIGHVAVVLILHGIKRSAGAGVSRPDAKAIAP